MHVHSDLLNIPCLPFASLIACCIFMFCAFATLHSGTAPVCLYVNVKLKHVASLFVCLAAQKRHLPARSCLGFPVCSQPQAHCTLTPCVALHCLSCCAGTASACLELPVSSSVQPALNTLDKDVQHKLWRHRYVCVCVRLANFCK
jgi:hypothetical protein